MEKQELTIAKERFVAACDQAKNVSLLQNAASAFEAATVVIGLRNALTPEVVKEVFVPLMNTKIGFLTDRDPAKGATPYPAEVVRDAIIDAASIGLLPIGNQMNIIAGRMYPTKEGYTALLKNMGVKYKIYIATPEYDQTRDHAKMNFSIVYTVPGNEEERYASCVSVAVNKKSNGLVVSSEDQLKGKAERRAKKALYEMISGFDFGEAADADSVPAVQDAEYTEIKVQTQAQKSLEAKRQRQAMTQALDNATEAEKEVAELQAAINAEPEQPNTAAVKAETAEPQPMAATRKSVHEQAMEIINRQKQQQSEE